MAQHRAKRQRSKFARPCALCGSRPATTAEHVPPKSFYTDKAVGQLITIPSCAECNCGSSKDDERLKIAIGLIGKGQRFGAFSGEPTYWTSKARTTLIKNRKLHRELTKNVSFPIPELPIIHIKADWLEAILFKSVQKMIHGYYFHFFKDILPSDASLRCVESELKKRRDSSAL